MTAIDPHRTLGLAPGASQAEIKRAYRHLAKLYHPDSAGERALPRFLAIQAAYEALLVDPRRPRAGGRGSANDRPAGPPPPSWQADPARARATREAYRARTRRSAGAPGGAGAARSAGAATGDPAAGPSGAPGSAGAGATGPASGAAPGRAGRSGRRPKATIGSTSYDGADKEPFTPAWEGATWYGAGSGTYWTLNPKEYADPRKHGPEYLARSRRGATAARPDATDDGGDPDGATAPSGEGAEPEPAAPGAAPHTDEPSVEPSAAAGPSAGEPSPRSPGGPLGSAVPPSATGATAAAGAGASTAPPRRPMAAPAGSWFGPPAGSPSLVLRLTRSLAGRVVLAVLAWIPLGVALAAAGDALPACGASALVCSDPLRAGSWPLDLLLVAVFIAVPRLAAIAAYGSGAFFAAGLLGTPVLLAIGGAHTPGGTGAVLAIVLVLAWLGGVLLALSGRVELPPWRGARTMLP